MIDEAMEEISVGMAEALDCIAHSDALKRLQNNDDFKLVIHTGYLQNQAVRLVTLKAAPPMQNVEKQTAILKSIDAIGELDQYLSMVHMMGDQAEGAVADARAEMYAIEEERGM